MLEKGEEKQSGEQRGIGLMRSLLQVCYAIILSLACHPYLYYSRHAGLSIHLLGARILAVWSTQPACTPRPSLPVAQWITSSLRPILVRARLLLYGWRSRNSAPSKFNACRASTKLSHEPTVFFHLSNKKVIVLSESWFVVESCCWFSCLFVPVRVSVVHIDHKFHAEDLPCNLLILCLK